MRLTNDEARSLPFNPSYWGCSNVIPIICTRRSLHARASEMLLLHEVHVTRENDLPVRGHANWNNKPNPNSRNANEQLASTSACFARYLHPFAQDWSRFETEIRARANLPINVALFAIYQTREMQAVISHDVIIITRRYVTYTTIRRDVSRVTYVYICAEKVNVKYYAYLAYSTTGINAPCGWIYTLQIRETKYEKLTVK